MTTTRNPMPPAQPIADASRPAASEPRSARAGRRGRGGVRLLRRIRHRLQWRFSPRSWRMRLMGCMLFMAFVPLAVFLAVQYAHTREQVRRGVLESLQAAATHSVLHLDAFLRSSLDRARMLAALPEVRSSLAADAGSIPRHPPGHWERELDAPGQEWGEFSIGCALLPLAAQSTTDDADVTQIMAQVLTDGRPRLVVASANATAGPALLFFAPVYGRDEARSPVGLARVAYSLEVLQAIVLRDGDTHQPYQPVQAHRFPMLVDERHQLLACGGHGLVEGGQLQLQPAWRMEVLPKTGESALLAVLQARDPAPSLHAATLRHAKTQGGFSAVFVRAMLREAPWKVLWVAPESVLWAPVRSQITWLGGAAAGVLALAALAGAGLSRAVTVPMRRLTQAARRVAAGDLGAVAPVGGGGGGEEMRELAQAFNAMTERLVRRLEVELLVGQISRRCLDRGMGEAGASMEAVLAMVGQFLAADHVFMLLRPLRGDQEQTVRQAYEWCGEGLPCGEGRQHSMPAQRFAWLWATLHGQSSLRVADVQTMPPQAAAEQEEFRMRALRSFMAVPVDSSTGMRGVLVAGSVWGRRAFMEEESSLLGIAAELLGNVLERDEALGALQASQERYALAQKAANIGSWEWDIPSGRLFWSDAIAPMFGLKQDEFSGTYKAFLERVHPDDRKLVLDAVGASFRHGVGYNVEHRILHAGGGVRWVAEAGEVSRNAQGRPERMRGILQDITERKWAEEALARLNRRLEQLVDARTRDLGHKAMELEAANARLLELDQMKTNFLTSVSHELRTPLTSILGFAKLVGKDFARHYQCLAGDDCRLEDRGRRILDNLDIISQEGERLTRLINDLLDLAKIESGRVEWRDERIAPEALVRRAVRAVSGQFAQKPRVALVVDVERNLPELFVDADRMAQVLINLMHNAVKFTTAGQVRLEVRTPRPGALQLRVEDTGQGIHLADLERIFDKFYQVAGQDTRVAKPEGTGLGLAICKQIVEHYKGAIWAESAWGQGSAFIVELPALAPAADERDASAA